MDSAVLKIESINFVSCQSISFKVSKNKLESITNMSDSTDVVKVICNSIIEVYMQKFGQEWSKQFSCLKLNETRKNYLKFFKSNKSGKLHL